MTSLLQRGAVMGRSRGAGALGGLSGAEPRSPALPRHEGSGV